tara:strand:- start:997 stop:1905 length:909 start_codon:yes stop_codon:yes gene_type:complete
MSSLWHPHVKQAPLQGLTGMWGGNSSNLVGGPAFIDQGTIQELFDSPNEPGIQTVVMNDGSSTRRLNFTRWSSKGWVEIMFLADVPYGYHQTSNFYTNYDGGYGLGSKNTSGSGNTLGLDYSQIGSQLMLGNNITTTDLLFTSKSSASLAQISPATGENQNSALPLRLSASIGGAGTQQSASKTAMLAYFRGTRRGFTFYQTAGTNADTFSGYWDKGGLSFGSLLHNRDGGAQLDHWFIASGVTNSGGTYYANIGFRGSTGGTNPPPYDSKFVGSWASTETAKPNTYLMDASNVFSVWVTDM